MPLDIVRQVRAADLLLAFEQELHVQRKGAFLGHERLGGLEHHVHRALVVGGAAPAHDIAVDGQLERGSTPVGCLTRRLDIVVPVDQDRRRAGSAEPFAADDGVTGRLLDPAAGEGQLASQPARSGQHGGGVGIAADARNRHELAQLAYVAAVVGGKRQAAWLRPLA